MSRLRRLADSVLLAAALGFALPVAGEILVLDYEHAEPVDFRTEPYAEDGTRTAVRSGHYEILADGSPVTGGDRAFNLDEENFGLSTMRLTVDGGHLFDVLSLEVVNPADAPGEIVISAVGGGEGSVSAPTVAGPLVLGPGFEGVVALDITQTAPGAFSIDDVTIRKLPEPAAIPAWLASGLLLVALRRLRA